ncbi:hypothetical protein DGMP_35760 [Desulfomarina profundi]|uniref:Fibronectin type-III domain-containing protein n=1 Tax=Desulfomarina profundi TaxID=2772557 RepID=A0A8D5JES3_9BACT|nr:hypothetical protein [Desulfomarina profundi]BCL62883.1 hypothetical protein DGMP_35760 [Desulfomarina profundi]
MTSRFRLKIAGFLGMAVLLLTAGCGYKNNPVPPESVVPQPIGDLRYTVGGQGVVLNWSYPVETIKGSTIDTIDSFELFRAEIPLDDYCGNCPVPFAEPLELPGGPPIDGKVRRSGSYTDSMLKSGYKYFYKIRTRTNWWASSDDSNIVSFTWFEPAASPQNLAVIPGDREITLNWQQVKTRADGQSLTMAVQYQVLRSVGGKGFEKLGDPVGTTRYVDRQVRNGQKYFYKVQSLLVHGKELVEGEISREIAAVPVDRTPPLPPSGVTAVWTSGGVKIFWDKNEDSDLGGYRVYRRTADSDSYELLGDVDPVYTLFVDASAQDTIRYYWAVTAIDKAKPVNESDKSREATIRY